MHGAQCSCAVTRGKQSLPISTFMTDSTDGTVTKEADKQNEITVRAGRTEQPRWRAGSDPTEPHRARAQQQRGQSKPDVLRLSKAAHRCQNPVSGERGSV